MAALAGGTRAAGAQSPAFWTDWITAAASGGGAGTASGTIMVGATPVTIGYAGEFNFAQTSGGTNYWQPRSTFLGTTLTDAAPITADLIAISGGTGLTNTFTFSAPIVDPFISIVSLGRPGVPVSYTFSSPFTIISGGPTTIFGGGPLTQPSANTVLGTEGNGTIQFSGTFSTLSFTTTGGEFWNGFTIGVVGTGDGTPPPAVIPEPSTVSLMALGLIGLAAAARTRRRRLA
ncbi:MAG TPA: PEP-CTERM sorting domain-containing protein [Gemmatimonadaceae bacterium]|nr:PEP-CTERM sorting domain-containing protein [Gemmatimonadaceae bacterium]